MKLDYFKESVVSPISITNNLFVYRNLVVQIIKQDIKGRFAGSLVGFLWNFLHPIITFTVYIFVFIFVFKLKIGVSLNTETSVIYIISGLFPWFFMAEGISSGTTCLIDNANLIKKTSFPSEVLVAQSVLTPFFSYGLVICILSIHQVFVTCSILILLFIPMILIVQIMFTLGVVFLCSAVSVYFRDIVQLIQVLISIGIFLCPIFYHISMLPDFAQKAVLLNPCYPIINTYQSVILAGSIVDWKMPLIALAWAVFFFVSGSFIFNKLKFEFVDWL